LAPPPGNGGVKPWVITVRNFIAVHQDQIDTLKSILIDLKNRIDGGDTKALIDYITKTPPVPAIQLRDSLLNSLPLSDQALAAIINRERKLPPGYLVEIIIPNAPVSDKVMHELQNRRPPLPPRMLQEIEQAQQNPPQYLKVKDLEREILYHRGEIILLEHEIVRTLLKRDTITEVENILRASQSIGSKKILAGMYYNRQDYAQSRAVLDTVMMKSQDDTTFFSDSIIVHNLVENQNFCKMLYCLLNVTESGRTITAMTNTEIQIITDVANANVPVSAIFELILTAVTGQQFTHYIKKETNQNNFSRLSNNPGSEDNEISINSFEDKLFRVYPNPASNSIIVETYFTEENTNISFSIYGILGKQIFEYRIKNQTTKLQINISNLPNGIYFYEFIINHNKIEQGKILIIK